MTFVRIHALIVVQWWVRPRVCWMWWRREQFRLCWEPEPRSSTSSANLLVHFEEAVQNKRCEFSLTQDVKNCHELKATFLKTLIGSGVYWITAMTGTKTGHFAEQLGDLDHLDTKISLVHNNSTMNCDGSAQLYQRLATDKVEVKENSDSMGNQLWCKHMLCSTVLSDSRSEAPPAEQGPFSNVSLLIPYTLCQCGSTKRWYVQRVCLRWSLKYFPASSKWNN